MKSILIAAVVMAACLSAAPVHAQGQAQSQAGNNINAVTQDGLISLGQANGYTTRQAGDGSAPAVELRTPEGVVFYAIGNACEEGTCSGVKLLGRHQPGGEITVAQVNALNRDVPPVKVWYNEDVMAVERYIILNGGVSQANLGFEMSTFASILSVVVERVEAAARGNAAQ